MSKIKLTEAMAEAIVFGGAVLGGGGGGDVAGGLRNAQLAVQMGSPVLISLDELDDEAPVITASAVGAPAAKKKMVRPVDHIRALDQIMDLISDRLGKKTASPDYIMAYAENILKTLNLWSR